MLRAEALLSWRTQPPWLSLVLEQGEGPIPTHTSASHNPKGAGFSPSTWRGPEMNDLSCLP